MLVVDEALPTDLIGRTVGERYILVRRLGGGGMGAVYEARHQWTGRRVALKLLHPQHQLDATVMQRFVREAQAATAIQHPNIVEVLDMGQDRGLLYMVQELLDGRDLAAELEERGALAPQEALDLAFPVMGALVAAHQRGILHRDIKPENIFLARTKAGVVPKVIDFGIAKVLEGKQDALRTGTGRIIGTPAYMAPEQVRGDVRVDARVDVWAVGVVLFQMLSGRLPFEAPTVNLVMLRIMTSAAPRLCDVAPSVPATVCACVDRALVADRDARYPSMRAFLAALLDCPDRVSGLDAEGLRDRLAKATLPDAVDPTSEAPTSPRDRTGLGALDLFDELSDDRPSGVTVPDPRAAAFAEAEPPHPDAPEEADAAHRPADAVGPPAGLGAAPGLPRVVRDEPRAADGIRRTSSVVAVSVALGVFLLMAAAAWVGGRPAVTASLSPAQEEIRPTVASPDVGAPAMHGQRVPASPSAPTAGPAQPATVSAPVPSAPSVRPRRARVRPRRAPGEQSIGGLPSI